MLGVGLRKLCPLDSLGYPFQRRNCPKLDPRRVQNRPAGGGRSEAVFGRPWGRSWDACGALRAVLGASWGVPGRSWAPLGGHVGTPQGLIWTIWALSVAQREIQQKCCILRWFWAARASRTAPKSLQNRPGKPLGRLLGPEIGLEGPRWRYKRPKLAPRVALGPAATRRDPRESCPVKSKSRLPVQT